MKIKEFILKVLKDKIGRIAFITLLVVITVSLIVLFVYNENDEVDTVYLGTILQKSSELTTAKLEYKGFSEFKDKGIVILNRSDFLMVYKATARAGIDVKKIKIDSDKLTKTIWITIPKAEILDVNVDPSKIIYYDEKFALFNVDEKEDSDRAQALAEKEAKEELSKIGILKMADDQAETLVKGLLQEAIPEGYKIKIKK